MPRHVSSTSRLSFSTSSTINLLPAAFAHFHGDGSANNNSATSKAALQRRRQILKHIPQIETPADEPEQEERFSARSVGLNLGELGARFGDSIPVVRAGATFLSTLHHSVALSASLHPPSNPSSAPPSPCLFPHQFHTSPRIPTSTVVRRRLSVTMATSPESSSSATVPAAGPAPLPSLDFTAATTDEERTEGLKLVADSIAQRRQLASSAIMTHPFFLGALGIAFTLVYQWLYKDTSDIALIITTCVGVLMAGFVGIRGAVAGYLELAEGINYSWLDDDEMVIARWGDGEERKVIGSVIYRIEKASGSGNGRKGKKIASVRAWTTRLRQRGNGVGQGLLEEMVKQAKKKGVESVRWEEGNIYETRILPKWANGGFEDGLKEARKKMETYIKLYMGEK